ncbi:hypothetical protein KSS87_015844, partial [Heliosperma pusillum]
METLSSTEPHYIRCVKPNNVLKPAIFENVNILNQLRCGGVLEAIRISCAGYPTRRTFTEFLQRFAVLAPELADLKCDHKVACQKMLDKMGLKGYQIGKTKVFLRAGQMAELDTRRVEKLGNAAKKIQRCVRTYIARKKFFTLRNAAIQIQSCCRAVLASKVHLELRRQASAIKIQKYFRRCVARKSYWRLRLAAISLQTGLRAMHARNIFRYKKQTKAAVIIQARVRCHMAYSYYNSLQKAALVTQCGWRRKVARKELKNLKMAARDNGALKEAKEKLEKRVQELTLRLQNEDELRTKLVEEKSQEVAKLQEALQAMRLHVEELNDCIIKEREAAKKAIEEAPPVIKEVPVMVEDTEKVESLTADINNLKELLQREKEVLEKVRKNFLDTEEKNSELLKKLEGSDDEIDQLKVCASLTYRIKNNLELNNCLTSLNLQELLQREEETSEKVRKALLDTEEKNSELLKKLEGSDDEIDQLKVCVTLNYRIKNNLEFNNRLTSLNLQELLQREEETSEKVRKALLDTEEKNSELLKKLEGSDDEIDQLKELLQQEKQASEKMSKAFLDTEEKNSELLKKLEGSDDEINQLKELMQQLKKLEGSDEEINQLKELLQQEKEASEKARNAFLDTEEKNSEMLKKLEDSDDEIDQLKELLQQEKKAFEKARKDFLDTEVKNSELLTKLEGSDNEIDQLKELLQGEKETSENLRKAFSDIEEKNSVLLEKLKHSDGEIDQLKELLQREKEAPEKVREAFLDTEEKNSELLKKLEGSDDQINQLKVSVQRMEEKLSNAESDSQALRQKVEEMTRKLSSAESEIQELTEKLKKALLEIKTLRQRAHTMTPIAKSAPLRSRTMVIHVYTHHDNLFFFLLVEYTIHSSFTCESFFVLQRKSETGHVQNGEVTTIDEDSHEDGPQSSLYEKQQEFQDLLIRCISQNLGYSKGKPVAASIIYKCLLHWRSFEDEKTSIFDRIIQTIGSAIEVQDNNDMLAYWLSNTSSLLLLLQQTLKATATAAKPGLPPQRRLTTSTSLFQRMTS